jgi:hypothetical protein
MATSGTWAFTLDLTEIIEKAYQRVGGELRSGFDYKTARTSLDLLMLEWQNRGLNLWTVKNASLPLVAGTASYTLPSERLDIIEGVLRTNAGSVTTQTDTNLTRISVSTYSKQTNKLLQSRPTQYFIQRAPEAITVTFWPVPDAVTTYAFNYYYLERVEDTGDSGANNVDVPSRYLPALIAGLAYHIGLETPSAFEAIPMLKSVYEDAWELAADSSREKASWYMVPGGYD